MQIINNLLKALFTNLKHNLPDRVENDTNQREDDKLTDDQEWEIPRDYGAVQAWMR